jgi:hypothetical protein
MSRGGLWRGCHGFVTVLSRFCRTGVAPVRRFFFATAKTLVKEPGADLINQALIKSNWTTVMVSTTLPLPEGKGKNRSRFDLMT